MKFENDEKFNFINLKCLAVCSRDGSLASHTGQVRPSVTLRGLDITFARFCSRRSSSCRSASSMEWPRATCLTIFSLVSDVYGH